MISRIFIILLFLLLPIVVALMSQRVASTVEPVVLPSAPIEVRLLSERKTSPNRPARGQDAESANDTPPGYTPRLIPHGAGEEADNQTNARPSRRDFQYQKAGNAARGQEAAR